MEPHILIDFSTKKKKTLQAVALLWVFISAKPGYPRLGSPGGFTGGCTAGCTLRVYLFHLNYRLLPASATGKR